MSVATTECVERSPSAYIHHNDIVWDVGNYPAWTLAELDRTITEVFDFHDVPRRFRAAIRREVQDHWRGMKVEWPDDGPWS